MPTYPLRCWTRHATSAILVLVLSVAAAAQGFCICQGNPTSEGSKVSGRNERDEEETGILEPEETRQRLKLRRFPELGDELIHQTTGGQELRGIEGYDNSGVTDRGAALLSDWPALEVISVGHSAISDIGLERLAQLNNLQLLILGSAPVTDAGLLRFRELRPQCVVRVFARNIRYAYGVRQQGPEGTVIEDGPAVYLQAPSSDATVSDIAEFREIRFVIAHDRVSASFYADYNLSNLSLQSLSGLPHLREVVIWNAKDITDDGLASFHGHTSLRRLDLRGSNVTRTGAEALREHIPECEVLYGTTD